jgi:hypothetical protein
MLSEAKHPRIAEGAKAVILRYAQDDAPKVAIRNRKSSIGD